MKISKNKLLIVTLLLLIFFTSRAQDVEISGSCITNTNALVLGGDTSNTTYNGNPVYYNRTLPVNYQGNAITTNLYLYYALASELGTPENRWVVAYGGQPYYYYITNATTAPLGQYLPFDTNATVTDCGGSVTISLPCTSFTTPLFDSVASICSGASLNDLPTISNNSYTGTWSPGIDNTATTTYTFTPTTGQCATTASLTITVNTANKPTGDTSQSFDVTDLNNITIANIVVNPSNVIWYGSLADAQSATNPLPGTTVLTTGATYYAVNVVESCSSEPFGVTVTGTLGTDEFDNLNFACYPNPTSSVVNISYSRKITQVTLINLLGQTLMTEKTDSTQVQVDLSRLAKATYFIKVASDDKEKVIKVIKQR